MEVAEEKSIDGKHSQGVVDFSHWKFDILLTRHKSQACQPHAYASLLDSSVEDMSICTPTCEQACDIRT